MRLPIILAVTVFALAGCKVNPTPNSSTQAAFAGVSTVINPVHDAQTSGFYAGR